MAGSAEEVKKDVKMYVIVLLLLAGLTIVTVGVSYLRLPVLPAVVLAMLIAAIKGSLVACCFMHLISENKVIWSLVILCAVLFVFLLLLPGITSVHYQE